MIAIGGGGMVAPLTVGGGPAIAISGGPLSAMTVADRHCQRWRAIGDSGLVDPICRRWMVGFR